MLRHSTIDKGTEETEIHMTTMTTIGDKDFRLDTLIFHPNIPQMMILYQLQGGWEPQQLADLETLSWKV